MKKGTTKIIYVMIMLIVSTKTITAQKPKEYVRIDMTNNLVRIPFWPNEICVDFFYSSKGKFTYGAKDYLSSPPLVGNMVYKNIKGLKKDFDKSYYSDDSLNLRFMWDESPCLKEVVKKCNKANVEIVKINASCEHVIGSEDKETLFIKVYLK